MNDDNKDEIKHNESYEELPPLPIEFNQFMAQVSEPTQTQQTQQQLLPNAFNTIPPSTQRSVASDQAPPNCLFASNESQPSTLSNVADFASIAGLEFTECTLMAESKYWGQAVLCGQRIPAKVLLTMDELTKLYRLDKNEVKLEIVGVIDVVCGCGCCPIHIGIYFKENGAEIMCIASVWDKATRYAYLNGLVEEIIYFKQIINEKIKCKKCKIKQLMSPQQIKRTQKWFKDQKKVKDDNNKGTFANNKKKDISWIQEVYQRSKSKNVSPRRLKLASEDDEDDGAVLFDGKKGKVLKMNEREELFKMLHEPKKKRSDLEDELIELRRTLRRLRRENKSLKQKQEYDESPSMELRRKRYSEFDDIDESRSRSRGRSRYGQWVRNRKNRNNNNDNSNNHDDYHDVGGGDDDEDDQDQDGDDFID